jgi:hypothetical protein
MNKNEFKKIVNIKKNQVFFMSTPLPFPLNFICHTFVITNEKGNINRWDVWAAKNIIKINNWDYLYKNLFEYPWQGNKINPVDNLLSSKTKRFNIKLIGKIEDDKTAIQMIKFIFKSNKKYKYLNKYFAYPGPNSNSYTQWILDNFSSVKIKLPFNAVGKGFKVK